MSKPHKNAALIKQWADDPSLFIWVWIPGANEWTGASLVWLADWKDSIFALGDKPTKPPRKTCTLAGITFPEPEREPPSLGLGTMYYVASPHINPRHNCLRWDNDEADRQYLEAGVLHLDRQAAEQHGLALMEATKQAMAAASFVA